jgi:hypothetical protein
MSDTADQDDPSQKFHVVDTNKSAGLADAPVPAQPLQLEVTLPGFP